VKVLKKILIVLGMLLLTLIAVSALLPPNYKVERTTTINAPMSLVFAQVNDFTLMDNWSPWLEYDPSMKKTYSGTVGQPGYSFSWESPHEKVGHGSLTRVTTEQDKAIINNLYFADFDNKSKDNWRFEQTIEGVKVSWFNTGEVPFIWRIPMTLMNMEKMMAPDFEKGLRKLKAYCERKKE
jgi:Polyketide cyclase / dehydrase and lipid transport